jgi:hypothetical protein
MRGRREGLRPDLCAWLRRPGRGGGHPTPRAVLMDVKTCYAGNPQYRAARRTGERGSAVARRAAMVPMDYHRLARMCDWRMADRAAAAVGGSIPPFDARYPGAAVTQHLSTFPTPLGLACGSYGEVSQEVIDYVGSCARAAGDLEWRGMGARTASEAHGIIMSQMLRRLSVLNHAGHMRVLYARLRYVGTSAATVRARGVGVDGDGQGSD